MPTPCPLLATCSPMLCPPCWWRWWSACGTASLCNPASWGHSLEVALAGCRGLPGLPAMRQSAQDGTQTGAVAPAQHTACRTSPCMLWQLRLTRYCESTCWQEDPAKARGARAEAPRYAGKATGRRAPDGPAGRQPGKRLAVAVWGAHLSASHGLGLWASTWRQPSVQGVGKGQGGLSCRLWPFGSAAGRIPARVQRAWRASPGSAPCLCCPGSHQCAAGACEPAFSARGHAAVKGSRPNKFSDISRTPD